MRTILAGLAITLAAAASWPAPAQSPAAAGQTLKAQDLFALSHASDPQIRPDGATIAYVRTTNDIMVDRGRKSIWLVDARTGRQTLFAGGDADAYAPRWSPDGTRIAYVGVPEGGKAGVYVRAAGGAPAALVGSVPREPSHLEWSPDGRTIAFVASEPEPAGTIGAPLSKPEGAEWAGPLKVITQMTYRADGVGELKPGHAHLFVVAADGGAPRQLTFGAFDDTSALSWTPDGRAIVFAARRDDNWEREPFRAGIYRVDVTTGALARLTTQQGPVAAPRVSPDGKHIAFSGYDDRYRGYENRRLYVMDADGGHVTMLAGGLDRSLDHPAWAADGRSLYADYVDHGVTKVAHVALAGAGVEDAAVGLGGESLDLPYSGGDFSVANDGTVAITLGGADHPPDVAVVRKGQVVRLTRLNDGLLAHKTLASVEALPVASSFDKAPIDAWLLKPPGFDPARKYPLVLEIHGGPFASYGPTFATDDQLYAAAGYVVLYANPRGSTSYGDVFANGIDRSYPGTDYDDLMSAVDAAVAKGFVDPNRLFVTGGSGGGVLTTWIVGKTHRFRAAVAQKPVVNWSSEVLTNDLYAWMARYWFGKQPWEDPEHYWARSPLSLVGNVTTPTMVVVGDQDLRTPDAEAEQYFDALMLRGVPTTLVKAPGAFHDMAARPSQAAAKANAILAWFARYDTGAAAP